MTHVNMYGLKLGLNFSIATNNSNRASRNSAFNSHSNQILPHQKPKSIAHKHINPSSISSRERRLVRANIKRTLSSPNTNTHTHTFQSWDTGGCTYVRLG